MADDDAPFLSRWARRKQAVQAEEGLKNEAGPTAGDPALEEAPEAGGLADVEQRSDRPLTPEEVAELPDPDTLEPGSDFKAFLREGVPEELKRRALRRLWRSNPVFGLLDGLNDYDLDYTDAATVVANLHTVFKVGKGAVLPEDQEAEAAAEPQAEDRSEDAVGQPPRAEAGDASAVESADAPATDEPESTEGDYGPEVAGDLLSTPPPDSPGAEPKDVLTASHAVAGASERPRMPEKGRAAQRRWGTFSGGSGSSDASSEGSGGL